MGKLFTVISCLLLSVGAVTSQTAQAAVQRVLPQWLTGIIAVVVFLFVAFVGVLVKKAWCEEPSRRKTTVEVRDMSETSLDAVRSKDDTHAYENLVMDQTEEKVTAM